MLSISFSHNSSYAIKFGRAVSQKELEKVLHNPEAEAQFTCGSFAKLAF